MNLLTTKEAAAMLRRSEYTLRLWACTNRGPIKPIRTARGAPLLWALEDIESLKKEKHGPRPPGK